MEPVVAYNIEIPKRETPDANAEDRINFIPASLDFLFEVSS